MRDTRVRPAQPSDVEELARLRAVLWPESSAEEHAQELELILGGQFPGTMPLVVLVAQASDGTLAGFLEAGLRSYADGKMWAIHSAEPPWDRQRRRGAPERNRPGPRRR